jgi:hypothetical protein
VFPLFPSSKQITHPAQLAFNTKDGRQITFPERLPLNRDTLTRFAADFLTGRLNSKAAAEAMAKKALADPKLNLKNLPTGRKPRKEAPAQSKGFFFTCI